MIFSKNFKLGQEKALKMLVFGKSTFFHINRSIFDKFKNFFVLSYVDSTAYFWKVYQDGESGPMHLFCIFFALQRTCILPFPPLSTWFSISTALFWFCKPDSLIASSSFRTKLLLNTSVCHSVLILIWKNRILWNAEIYHWYGWTTNRALTNH